MSYPIPENEEERLELLQQLDILDSLGEESYDFITKVAAEVFEVPIASITFVDEERQWLKSRIGLDIAQTPREHAFCTYNILDDEMLIVEDASTDPRFADNPFVTGEPNIRFYAGSPIQLRDDIFLGSVCILDTKPRQLDEKQKQILTSLGKQVSTLLQMRKVSEDLRQRTREVEHLQQLLPKCSRCGNVRSDDDYWTSVDDYLQTHTHQQVTQSLCPDCSADLDEHLSLV